LLSDISTDKNFPIKERLDNLYGSDKVISLNKNGIYLIITIEQESEGGTGGIFPDDEQYNKFIANKDLVMIDGSTFYLKKSNLDIPSLLKSHGGPYMWSALVEYLPKKTTGSSNIFKGYENIIKRNGYNYNFIIVSNEGGQTNSELQGEIVNILESIKW
jgi:hypothetical protein